MYITGTFFVIAALLIVFTYIVAFAYFIAVYCMIAAWGTLLPVAIQTYDPAKLRRDAGSATELHNVPAPNVSTYVEPV